MKKAFRLLRALALIGVLSGAASAITWVPQDFTCPIDNEKNTFLVVASYGSYIYAYPSKYQWLFFPQTASPTYYLCRKCRLVTYMWDFDKLPKEKLAAVKSALASARVSKDFKQYTEIPVSERLEIMEKVYAVLGKDESWWESFYRVKGYHYGKEGKAEKAVEARRKSLEIIQKELANEQPEAPRKMLLYISGSLKHFLNDDRGALADLQKALTVKYESKTGKPEDAKSAEEGMNERIKDYLQMINSTDKKPRLFDKADGDADSHDDH